MFCEWCGREIPASTNRCEYCMPNMQIAPAEQIVEKKQYQYAVEYVKNGFFLGGSKLRKIAETIDRYTRNDWRVISTTYHQSMFLLFFPRCGTIITFERERDSTGTIKHKKHTRPK